jgi:predicted transcriptional regulator of viral defense system
MMMEYRRGSFSSYLTRLLSEGRLVFTSEQAQKDLGIAKRALIDAASRQQKQRGLLMPRRGFYVIVPPQYLSFGAPPPSLYIDSLMRYEGRPYYVGLLKAAELHGASHQAVMQFQVVTDKRLPKIRAGRSAIVFYYRKDMNAVTAGLEERKTESGLMKVSCVELTMLDLLRYQHAGAGVDNIATVIRDLGGVADPQKLAALSTSFERTVIQRLGYLLDRLGHNERTDALRAVLTRYRSLPWIELEPGRSSNKDFPSEPVERVERWHVIVRRVPEIDE